MQVQCGGCFRHYDDQYEICPHCGYYHGAKPKEAFAMEIGTVLQDRYVIGNEIGLGGFGITYKAWDKKLETIVAIKEYYPSGMVNRVPGTTEVIRIENKMKAFQFGLERLILEAQFTAQFNTHDNIVHVLSYFEANNTAYIVMEFLDGCTLGEYVQKNGLGSWEDSVDIILKICEALNVIHASGIIHRDISPDNIFMCNNGAVKLIDFGAARFAKNMESNYTVILKPGFAPPEQYTQISEQGPWTDVYAVGATLYYLVTGQKPEESTNRKTKDTLREPIEIRPELPQYLSDGIMKAMAIEPHLRFQTIREFVAVIKRERKVVSLKTERKRRRIKRFAGIAVLVAVLAWLVFSIVQNNYVVPLEAAEIEMWYVENEAKTLETIYQGIVDKFCEENEGVTVTLKGFDSEQALSAALAGGKPNLVQADAETAQSLSDLADLKNVVSPAKAKYNALDLVSALFKGEEHLFMRRYDDYFPTHTYVPSGFTAPVLYVNSSLVEFEQEKLTSYEDLAPFLEAGDELLIDEKMAGTFTELFGFEDAAVATGSVEDFVAGDAAFFLSDTGVYFDVRTMPSKLTGTPKVIPIEADALPCTWNILWSVAQRDEAQDKAAERLLETLIDENAQSELFVSVKGGNALPINRDALSDFCDTFGDLDFVPSVKKQCTFGEMR